MEGPSNARGAASLLSDSGAGGSSFLPLPLPLWCLVCLLLLEYWLMLEVLHRVL